jgi:hypothetical protein
VTVFSYFQPDFQCSFIDNNLKVAAKSHYGSKNCLDTIAQLKTKKTQVSKQIEELQWNSAYNKSVRIKLIKQRTDIDTVIGQVASGINNLEAKTYATYKKKYFTKLKPIRAKLIAKQAALAAELASSLNDGEKALVTRIIKTIGFNYQRIKLIEGILTSKTLDEMIPMLNTYEGLITSQLAWKSE